MGRPIKLTEEDMKDLISEFGKYLKHLNMFDGEVKFSTSYKFNRCQKATLQFAPLAYSKMLALVNSFDDEIAWHGTCYRDEEDETKFVIKDIYVYPQTVTGTTVTSDQTEYSKWLYSFDDEVFNNLRMQGHSHVNMSTTPSGVDLTHQNEIINQLQDDMFYVFIIWNKKMDRTIKIFDLKNNTLYENSDVIVRVGELEDDMDKFIADSKKQVSKKSYQTTSSYDTYKKSWGKAKQSKVVEDDEDDYFDSDSFIKSFIGY